MRGYTLEGDIFSDTSIAAVTHCKCSAIFNLAGMDHHSHVNTIKIASVDKFYFTAEIFDNALLAKCFTISEFDQFFCRNSHETDGAA